YNSAFMNMLKNEENAKYRRTIKNTLEYDPEILKRFVNFMNNPDEESAVAQFGTGDKYFGVATLMVTMPGLPMWGHGQIEGFAEKYGMEYRQAYWNETPDEALIARHNREIFPLMHRRYLFADATNFRLFDVYSSAGDVHPHVYAYSNRHHDERALVLYNNFWERIEGWIHTSSPFVADTSLPTDQQKMRTEQLAPALGISGSWQRFTVFQEQRSGLWFIRNSGELAERGLYVALNGYESQVFLNLYEVEDNQYTHYARLADFLNGAGTADINRSLKRLLLQPLHDAFGVVANTGVLRRLTDALATKDPQIDWKELADEYRSFLSIAGQFSEHTTRLEDAAELFEHNGEALIRLPQLVTRAPKTVASLIESHLTTERTDSSVFLALALMIPLDVFVQGDQELTSALRGFRALDQAAEWELITRVAEVMEHLSAESELPTYWEPLVQVILAHHNWWSYVSDVPEGQAARTAIETLLADPNVEDFLGIHVHNGVTWFNKEMFELMIDWLVVVAIWQHMTAKLISGTRIVWKEIVAHTRQVAAVYTEWLRAESKCEYRVEALLDALQRDPQSEKSPRKR
ncbi:MAG: alpha-amylase, partial [Alkalispirochaeta sp.]